jgi:hypothetical protein
MIKNATKQLMPAVTIGAGAIAQGYALKLIPIENPNAKNAVTFAIGLILAGQKNKMLAGAGLGMAAESIKQLASGFGIGATNSPIMDMDDMDRMGELDAADQITGDDMNGTDEMDGTESPVSGASDNEADLD